MQQVKSSALNAMNEEAIKKLIKRKDVELVSHGEVKGIMARNPKIVPIDADEIKITDFKKQSKLIIVPPLKVMSRKGSTNLGGEKKEFLFYYV